MLTRLKKWWPWLKLALFAAILLGVGWQFRKILAARPDLWDDVRAARLDYLVLSGLLYLAGLGFSAYFWLHLLRQVGQPIATGAGVRAYYVSQLGKYTPVKGFALIMRTTAATGAGVRPGAALLTGAYETLTTMAAGALLAAGLILWLQRQDQDLLWKALILLALAGIPILPGVFNRVLDRLTRKFRQGDAAFLPPLRYRTLLFGVLLTACGWLCLGASLQATLLALRAADGWNLDAVLKGTAFMAVAYVAGFLVSTPGSGLGVREFFLQQCLAPTLGAMAVVAALLVRVVWTLAELVMACVVYWLSSSSAKAPVVLECATEGNRGERPII